MQIESGKRIRESYFLNIDTFTKDTREMDDNIYNYLINKELKKTNLKSIN